MSQNSNISHFGKFLRVTSFFGVVFRIPCQTNTQGGPVQLQRPRKISELLLEMLLSPGWVAIVVGKNHNGSS
jgi:hypothetical protein